MDDTVFLDLPLLSFDEEFYLAENPDVAEAIATGAFQGTAEDHYLQFGDAEGRDPNMWFDVSFYFATVPPAQPFVDDGIVSSSLADYEIFGILEGRANVPSPELVFDPTFYLASNPDVLLAIVNGEFGDPFRPEASGFAHFVLIGFEEGRLPNAGTSERLIELLQQDVSVRIAGAAFAVDNPVLQDFLTTRSEALADLNVRIGPVAPSELEPFVEDFFGGTAIPDELFVPVDEVIF